MIFISGLLDSYFKAKLKGGAYRRKICDKALRRELRTNKIGHIILRNLGDMMAANPAYHEEMAGWIGNENYQKVFWESDLGYLWYQGNLNAQNKYFEFAIGEIKKNGLTSVLDVGCGWGQFCHDVSVATNIELIKGIDVSESIIRDAKEKFPGTKIIFECKDVLEETGKYDLITLFGSTDYILPSVFEDTLNHLLEHANKEIIIVNSLRGVPFERALEITEAIEVKRYDDGFLHPVNFLLKNMDKKFPIKFEVKKFGADSLMAVIYKN